MAVASRFGTLLRVFRKRAKLTQADLASSLNVKVSLIKKWETGRSEPPRDPALYDRLRTVPGFTKSDVTLLREAAGADKSSEDLGKLLEQLKANWQSIRKILEGRLRNPQSGSSIEVRRQGLAGKSRQDLAQVEAAKANQERAILLAHHLKDLGGFAASGEQYVVDAIEYMTTIADDLPDELKPIGQALTQVSSEILTASYAESLRVFSALSLEGFARATEQPPQAALPTGEEESTDITQILQKHGSIPPPMPPKPEVEDGDHLKKHVNDLQSQGKLGSERREQPNHYPHENVVFHVAQLQAEALGKQPDRLVTIKEGVSLTGLPHGTIGRWLSAGRLKERGRQWLARPGGRSIPMYSLADLTYLKDNPPPIGKRITKEKPKTKRGVAFEGRHAREGQEQQAAESSERLITLAEASQISGITLGTLYNYVYTEKLTVRGREPYPGGGKILVDPAEVRSLPRRPKGRPKKSKGV
jgi:transcriptional regulator with XRE-family HTH domain/predicted DNA-binding transcriptional regulator AlpA